MLQESLGEISMNPISNVPSVVDEGFARELPYPFIDSDCERPWAGLHCSFSAR
jgi:hypothetical protein